MVQSAGGLGVKSAADVFSVTGITLAGPPAAELLVWITAVPCKFSRFVVITRVVKVIVREGIVVAVTMAVTGGGGSGGGCGCDGRCELDQAT
jgi:hypothetical protein